MRLSNFECWRNKIELELQNKVLRLHTYFLHIFLSRIIKYMRISNFIYISVFYAIMPTCSCKLVDINVRVMYAIMCAVCITKSCTLIIYRIKYSKGTFDFTNWIITGLAWMMYTINYLLCFLHFFSSFLFFATSL